MNDKGKTISVEVYDDDFGKENFIGSYTVQLREAIKNADSITGWHKLEGCKTGNIKLSAKYTPDELDKNEVKQPEQEQQNGKESFESRMEKATEYTEEEENLDKVNEQGEQEQI